MNQLYVAVVLAVALVLTPEGAAVAVNHDEARRAYEAGEVVGLGRILKRVRAIYNCRVLEVELHQARPASSRSRWIYAVKVLTRQGNVLMIRLDGKTMNILNVSGRGADAAQWKP